MSSNRCLTILHASVLALLVGTVEMDSECETGIKVHRNTVYEALHGQDLIINCTVVFCNSSPPTVSWYKAEGSVDVPVDVSRRSHIETEWEELSHSEGISHLIFQNILNSDSGLYRCRSGDDISHSIKVSVSGECETGIKVRRNTVYEALHGQDLIINCTVVFCNSSPPTVSWYKAEGSVDVPVNVSRRSHIETEWKELSHSEGISHLIFQNIFCSDSGLYRCGSGDDISHRINVSVSYEPTTGLRTAFWPCAFRFVIIKLFLIIVTAMCVTSMCRRKGACCAEESRDAPEPSRQPSHQASPTIHIYENDPSTP